MVKVFQHVVKKPMMWNSLKNFEGKFIVLFVWVIFWLTLFFWKTLSWKIHLNKQNYWSKSVHVWGKNQMFIDAFDFFLKTIQLDGPKTRKKEATDDDTNAKACALSLVFMLIVLLTKSIKILKKQRRWHCPTAEDDLCWILILAMLDFPKIWINKRNRAVERYNVLCNSHAKHWNSTQMQLSEPKRNLQQL